jgi:hypothetical protein
MSGEPPGSELLGAFGRGDPEARRAVVDALLAEAREWFEETARADADLPGALAFARATGDALRLVLEQLAAGRPAADWPEIVRLWRERLRENDPRPVLAAIWRVVAGVDNVRGGDEAAPLTGLPIEETLRLEFVRGRPETVDLVVDTVLAGARRRTRLGLHDAEDCCRDVVRSAILEPWRSWRTMLRHWVTVASKRMRRPSDWDGRRTPGEAGPEAGEEDDDAD